MFFIKNCLHVFYKKLNYLFFILAIINNNKNLLKMSVSTIIHHIMTDLFRYLSLSQRWFTRTPLPSMIYGIANMIIQTGDILKECIKKDNPSFVHNVPKEQSEDINIALIISNLFHNISSQSTVGEAAIKVIDTSEILKIIIEIENNNLLKDGGDVFYEGNEMTFVLLREGKRIYYNFPGQLIQILRTNSVEKCKELKLKGPPDEDGFTYYLQALPYIWDPKITAVQLSKKEAVFLTKRNDQVNDAKYGMVYM
jgi:hypothetical protein